MGFQKTGRVLGAVSMIALASATSAQETDANLNMADAEGAVVTEDRTAAVDGRVVVDQGEPKVSVTIDEPNVDVDQRAPEVTVEQPQPEITVAVPEPNVSVEQQAPIVTVEQAQPTVSVRIPEPVISIRVPRPAVDVDQANPDVAVQTPEPVVKFIRPEPKVMIEEAEPRVEVSQAEPQVAVDEAEDAQIDIATSEPEINVRQADEADVAISQAEPEVRVKEAEEAVINVNQEEARVVLMDYETDQTGEMQSEEDRASYAAGMERHPMYDMTADELMGVALIAEDGEDVGEIERVGSRGDVIVAIVGVGGFLGMGECDVAVPLDRLTVAGDSVVLPETSESELRQMPEFRTSEVEFADPEARVGDLVVTR
ncbi:MAG TPA: photosystem reaction center subunit H [Rhodobacteraceae bacterium]|nr:photosystem reaction center subunit H [Paracoccaceae bacterium]